MQRLGRRWIQEIYRERRERDMYELKNRNERDLSITCYCDEEWEKPSCNGIGQKERHFGGQPDEIIERLLGNS